MNKKKQTLLVISFRSTSVSMNSEACLLFRLTWLSIAFFFYFLCFAYSKEWPKLQWENSDVFSTNINNYRQMHSILALSSGLSLLAFEALKINQNEKESFFYTKLFSVEIGKMQKKTCLIEKNTILVFSFQRGTR